MGSDHLMTILNPAIMWILPLTTDLRLPVGFTEKIHVYIIYTVISMYNISSEGGIFLDMNDFDIVVLW